MAFTCPDCHRTSHHPMDERFSYCGNCHAFTRMVSLTDVDEMERLLGITPRSMQLREQLENDQGVNHSDGVDPKL